jgi:hypothetical protein
MTIKRAQHSHRLHRRNLHPPQHRKQSQRLPLAVHSQVLWLHDLDRFLWIHAHRAGQQLAPCLRLLHGQGVDALVKHVYNPSARHTELLHQRLLAGTELELRCAAAEERGF